MVLDKEELERRRKEALAKAEETNKQKTLELKRKQVWIPKQTLTKTRSSSMREA